MKILFVYQIPKSFIEKDKNILSSRHEIREVSFTSLLDAWRILINVFWCDVTFSWFGKLHAFFAVLFSKIFRKKCIVIAGGDDVAYIPEIKYGIFCYWWKRWCPLFVFRYADLILSVSRFNHQETIKNAKVNPAKVKLICHGFDFQEFTPASAEKEKRLVITVGGVDWDRLERKGYERFVRSAAYLPDVQFALIGQWYDDSINYLREIAPKNVIFTGELSDAELLKFFSRAKVYVQASLHEAFGCSLAEAMLCECIPVVSRNAAITEVVGNTGVYVDELTPENIAEKVKNALNLSGDYGKKAQNRIIEVFPLSKRKREILEAVEKISNELPSQRVL